jgi:hypothetical protein
MTGKMAVSRRSLQSITSRDSLSRRRSRRYDTWVCYGTCEPRVACHVEQGLLTNTTECSAMKNRGVNEAFTEAARVALTVKNVKGDKDSASCSVM